MSTPELMADLAQLGIRLESHGDRLRYAPQSAVSSELAAKMKTHKGELLAALRDDTGNWATIRPDGGLSWIHPDHVDDDQQAIDPPPACPECGSLDLWQSAASDLLGLTPGRWRCTRCDPPPPVIMARSVVLRSRIRASEKTKHSTRLESHRA